MDNFSPPDALDSLSADAAGSIGAATGGKSIFTGSDGQANEALGPNMVQTFSDAAVKYQVPANVLMGLAEKDSNFNPHARSTGIGSKSRGIISLSDEDVAKSGANPYEPDQAVGVAAQKFQGYLKEFNSVPDAVKAMKFGPNRDAWGPEAELYAQDVLGRSQKLKQTYFGEQVAAEAPVGERVIETETKYEEKVDPRTGERVKVAVPPTVEEQRKMFNIPDPGRPGIAQQAGEDVQRGFANLANIGRGVKALGQTAIGDEEGAAATLNEYVKREYLNARENPAIIGTYKNIGSLGDAGRYAIEAIGENMAMALPSLFTGGTGAAIGRVAVGKAVERMVEEQVAAGVSREAAEVAVAKVAQRQLAKFAAAGAYPSAAAMEAGSIEGDIYKETGQNRPGVAVAGGAVAGALDMVEPVMAITKVAGSDLTREAKRGLIRNLLTEGAKQFGAESITEGLQTVIEDASVRYVDGKPLFTDELLDKVIDSSLKGGIGGGGMGVASEAAATGLEKVRDMGDARTSRRAAGEVLDSNEGAPRDMSALKALAEEAPGRQTGADLQAAAEAAPVTEPARRAAGEGPLSRALNAGAPHMAPLVGAAGERVTLTDENGPLSGAVISQDADGILFKDDTGFEQFITNQEIASGKVSIARGDSSGVSPQDSVSVPVAGEPSEGASVTSPTDFPPGSPPAEAYAMTPRQKADEEAYYNGETEPVEQPAPAPEPVAAEPPAAVAPRKALGEMNEAELRGRLKDLSAQAKAAGGWNPTFMKMRASIEQEITARQRDAASASLATMPDAPSGVTEAPAPVAEKKKPAKKTRQEKIAEAAEKDPPFDMAAAPAAPATPAPDFSNRVWGARSAAQAVLENKGLGETHEVVDNGKGRFTIALKKEAVPVADVSTESTRPENVSKKSEKTNASAEPEAPKSTYGKPKKAAPEQRRFDTASKAGPVFATKNQHEDGYNVSWASTHVANAPTMDEAARIAEHVAKSGADNIDDMRKAAAEATQPAPAAKAPKDKFAKLEAIKEEEAAAPAKSEKKYTQIGVNRNGDPLFEDENKIRSFVSDGVRQTESVLIEGGRARPRNPAARSNDFELPVATAPAAEPKPAPKAKKPAAPAPAADYGSDNKFVTRERADEVREKLKAKLKAAASTLNSGVDPEMIALGTELAIFHIEAGSRKFADFAKYVAQEMEMSVSELKPYLRAWYNAGRDSIEDRGGSIEGTDEPANVKAELDRLLTEGSTNEPAKLDQPSAGALEGVPAGEVQGATEGGPVGEVAETGGRADVSGARRAGRKRDGSAGRVGDGAGDLFVSAGRDERVDPPAGKRAAETAADFAISDADQIGTGGKKTKYKQNIEAIRIIKRLAETSEAPSTADQKALAKYVGWGGIPEAFERSDGSISVGWAKEAKELKELLTADEYSEAAASTQYAHYTAPEVVSAMWDGMRRMGFAGGRVLEPGMGVGNFFGLMPKDLRNASALHGVEKDIITGGVAKGLYPAAKIAAPMDFRDYSIPDGYFDAAIGNPPFASTKIKDTANRDISGFSLHNYFFAKALNGLKPGGVMSMVVTSRMLDSISDTSRQYMADRADLVAAIRLPNNAFLKNAGTQVTTDIIILRKRKEGEAPSKETWAKVGEYTNEKGQTVPLNEYFIRHPENMLGEFGPFGSMYSPDEPALVAREGQDTTALLQEAMARLPENITSGAAVEVKDESSIDATSIEHVRVGSAFMQDGKVMLREQDRLGEAQATEATFPSEKAKERVVGMIGVRDAFAKLRALQLDSKANDKQIAEGRKALNDVYDKFVKKNGYINEEANKRLFRDDPSWPQIAALEEDFNKGVTAAVAKTTGQAVAKPSAKKAAIFSKRTQSPYAPPTKAATAKDALVASLSESGRVDLDLMAKLYGKDPEAIRKELGNLVFEDPIKGPVTREEYLSGNVKAKLAQAIEAAQNDPAMQRNVDALREVQPADVEAIDIDVKIGSHWVPIGVMREFSQHILGTSGKLKVIYNPATAGWTVSGDPSTDASTRWGTSRVRVADVIEAAANQRAIVVRDRMTDGSSVVNEVDTQAANDKVQAVKDEWRRWVFDEDSRRETLGRLYNDMFNTNVNRVFDGSHLTFPGKVGDDVVRLRPHQANAVWRALQSSTTLFDHVVGAGKTFTMIAAAMEMRRMGLAKKPMFVVPNHLVGQWAADFVKLYPNAQILAATKKDFEKDNRKKLFARIATGDWDAVIVAHSSFQKVEVDPDSQTAFIEKQVADLLKTEEAMRAADGKDSRNVKQVQNRIEKLREKQKRLLDTGTKDDSLYWKELGVDALYLDEAHEFKNLEFSTSMQRVAGLGNQSGSGKASDLYLKVNQVLEATGGRNVVFATGTPISNTMAEMFTMQRYLDGKALDEQGISHFDAWARLYGDVVTDWELSPSGSYKLNSRFAKFVNMPELMQRYTSFADVINRDDINAQLAARGETLPVPKVKGGKPQNIVVERSPDQADFMASLVQRSENLPKKVSKGSDNMLKIMSDARKSALDMRLIDPAYPDYAESKVNNAAGRIVDLYHKWDADKGTQLVFIDLSTPKGAVAKEQAALRELIAKAESSNEEEAAAAQEKLDAMSPDELLALDAKFSVYDDLKQKLIARGIPENEIAFIHDASTELKKEELFGKVKSGRVRVLLGSTAKMGAGMNVQERLVALHHLDAPWRPSDLEQREGRIIRQGNVLRDRDPDNFEVEINRYAAKGTLDSRMWQTIEGKARFIEQVRKGTEGSREVEDVAGEAANAAEMKAAASGNPLILEEMTLRQRVKKLENEERAHRQEQWSIKDRVKQNEKTIAANEATLTDMRADAMVEIPEEFSMAIRGETFDKRKEAGEKIIEEAANLRDARGRSVALGTYGGFKIGLAFNEQTNVFNLTLKGTGEYNSSSFAITADPQGVAQRLVMLARGTRDIEGLEKTISESRATIEKLNSQVKDWPKQEELAAAKARHGEIISELKPKQKPAEAPAEEPKASIGSGVGMSVQDLRATLTQGVDGAFVSAMIDAGKIVIEPTANGMPPGAQAVTMRDGTIRLAASNMNSATARGVLLHEAFHAGGQTLLGAPGFKSLLRRVETIAGSAKPGSWAADAKARAEAAGTSPEHMAEEIAAYAIENAENAPAGIREIADRLVGAVKAFVLRRFGKQFGAVTPGQLRALAVAALRSGQTAPSATVRPSIASTIKSTIKLPKGNLLEKAKEAAADLVTSSMVGVGSEPGQFSSLAMAPVRALFTELSQGMPAARSYIDTKQAMDQFRNEMNVSDDETVRDWMAWAKKNKAANDALMKVMHLSTLDQYDPQTRKGTPSPEVQKAYDALPDKAKELYATVRDAYSARANAVEKQIIENVKGALAHIIKKAERTHAAEMERIEDEGLTGAEKKDAIDAADKKLKLATTRIARNKAARLKRMQAYFEMNRLKGPYFPLARFGNFLVTVRDDAGKIVSFEKYESRSQQRAAAEGWRDSNPDYAVEESSAELRAAGTGTLDPLFVSTIDDILDGGGVDPALRDQIYQAYLETMPDLSMRKARIHRKGTAGFSEDAIRAFASNMFHSGHQLSRLRYGMQLQDHLADAKGQIRASDDPTRTQAVYNEMMRAHNFTMNPDGSSFAHHATSLVFLYTMAFNLSTAMVNTLQTVTLGIPNIAFDTATDNKAGIKAATVSVAKSATDFVRGKGTVLDSSTLTDDERAAVNIGYKSGVIDSTQAHDLAGVAESGIKYRPGWQAFMRMASYPMHQTERFNREVTYLAAYRVARDAGLTHEQAIKKASDQTWATHFDNQSTSKPRFARSQLGKILFALKSYQANAVFRIFRDLHQSLNGVSEKERNVAMKRFASMFALTAASYGIRGAFFYSTVMAIAGAFMGLAGMDDDDPDEVLRKWVTDTAGDTMIGRAVSGMMMDGVLGYMTGTALTNRGGMADMWFRTNDRDMTAEQSWSYWLEQAGGASLGVAHQFLTGLSDVASGNVERGVEKMVPAFIRNVMKGVRYAREGVQDKNGNPLVENVPMQDVLKQMIGFTPAEIADRYARNTYQNNLQSRIEKKQTDARKAYSRAVLAGDDAGMDKAMEKIDAYNEKYPEFSITGKSIKSSIKSMESRKEKNEYGVQLNPKLAERVKSSTARSIYSRQD